MTATPEHVYHARVRRWVVRAFWETPRVIRPDRDHAFKAEVCTRCGDPEDGAGPDRKPMVKAVDPRTHLPVDPRWLVEPLKWLHDAGPTRLAAATENAAQGEPPSCWKRSKPTSWSARSHDAETHQASRRLAGLQGRPQRSAHPRPPAAAAALATDNVLQLQLRMTGPAPARSNHASR